MTQQPRSPKPTTTLESPDELVAEWLNDYHQETVREDGDPEGFVERVQSIAEESGPGTIAALALPLFLERLAMLDDTIV